MKKQRAFTLLELLVVIGIIALLGAVTVPVISKVQKMGSQTREISAARQLMSAHAAYAGENNGDLLPGYGNFPAIDENGARLKDPINRRYPWRLAPYLRYEMRIFWGNNADDELHKLKRGPRDAYVYAVSVEPALGINATFVGGDYQRMPPDNPRARMLYGQFCATRMIHATKPQRLIVFASAAAEFQGKRLPGYFKVEAPYFTGRTWPAHYSEGSPPDRYGNVDFRYDGKAVAAMLDGHVEMLDFDQMNDMRRWSPQAALADNPSWALGSGEEPASGGITLGDHVDANPTNSNP